MLVRFKLMESVLIKSTGEALEFSILDGVMKVDKDSNAMGQLKDPKSQRACYYLQDAS